MTQRDGDQLVTLHKAQKKLITQREAAKELDVTARHLRRLLKRLKAGRRSSVHPPIARQSFQSTDWRWTSAT
jgi:hypothetical protein